MSNFDILDIALKSLIKRKLRTFLTIFGVVIGTCSIVIMLSLGIAMSQSFEEIMDDVGDVTVITVNPSTYLYGNETPPKDALLLDDNIIENIGLIDNIVTVSPEIHFSIPAKSGKLINWLNIIGINLADAEIFGYNKVEEGGTILTENDKMGMIFGPAVAYNFYNPNSRNIEYSYYDPTLPEEEQPIPPIDVMNDRIVLSQDAYSSNNGYDPNKTSGTKKPPKYNANVLGIIDSTSWDTNYSVFMNINDVKSMKIDDMKYSSSGNSKKFVIHQYDTVKVKVDDVKNVQTVSDEIVSMGFQVYSSMDFANSLNEMSSSIQMFLGFIGGISLFISAIGITNTMIMSIYERTREIGIMKVIGATINDIRRMFLLEAGLIGFFGGIVGLIFSYIISYILNNFGNIAFLQNLSYGGGDTRISIIPIYLSILTLVFSTFVGLISGYLPARRATKLRAIDAIRSE